MKSILLILLVFNLVPVFGQNTKEAVEERRFTIEMESVTPQRGGYRSLTAGYRLTVTPDTVTADLPYFGRAYQAQINPSDAGVKFTSTDFEYTVKDRKKGWNVQIKPKDATRYSQLILMITESGRATVRVIPTDREGISYNGTIRIRNK